ncbi:MAG: D-glycero-beta-D-manno-heptose 1-phosphate adenylyltransferase [Flavobacteriales bacterium]
MSSNKDFSQKVYTHQTIVGQLEEWADNKIVFTNGCFDILHLGHIDYLNKASQLGDKLIVGVNSDRSVKQLKGNNRPIQDEIARLQTIAALQSVDAVILFQEETPLALVELILPDVLVKGADYALENISGAKEVLGRGGQVKTIPFLDGYSTTSIINKIKNG